MAWVSRLESTHRSLLSFQIVLFELLHRLSPLFNEHVIDLAQISLSSSKSVFVSLMSAAEFVEVKRWPHLRKRQSELHLVLQAIPRQDILSVHLVVVLRIFSRLVIW